MEMYAKDAVFAETTSASMARAPLQLADGDKIRKRVRLCESEQVYGSESERQGGR